MDQLPWLFFTLGIFISHGTSQTVMHAGSQCFHVKGVPTLQLKCPGGELIKTHNAFYGAPKNSSSCGYDAADDHCIQLTDLHENCNGRYMCSVYVSNPFLMNCRTYATYMQVNYTCIPKTQVHDVCQSVSVTTTQGYMRTPNYPDANYTSNLHCGCRLRTKDSNILLKVIDFSVNHTRPGICNSDYMRIANWGKKCGHIGASRLPERLELDRQDLTVEFHTDDTFQARGFWLEFQGSYRGAVQLTCGAIQSNINNRGTAGGGGGGGRQATTPQRRQPSDAEDEANNLILIDDTDEYPRGKERTPYNQPPRTQQRPRGVVTQGNDDNTIYRNPQTNDAKDSSSDTKPLGKDEPTGEEDDDLDDNSIHSDADKKDNAKEGIENAENEVEKSETEFDTYEFNETQENYVMHGMDTVQIITGCVVGVLILIAVIIIVVLVFRR